jgi:periplasmic protein TonB
VERPCGKTAIVASVLLHGAVFAALTLRLDSAPEAPHGGGMAGIAVSLSPGGGTSGLVAASPFDAASDVTAEAATAVSTVEPREDTPLIDPQSIEATAPEHTEPTREEPAAAKPLEAREASAVQVPDSARPVSEEPTAAKPLEAKEAEMEATTIETVASIEPQAVPPASKDEQPRTVTPDEAPEAPPQVVAATAPTKTAAKTPQKPAAVTPPDAAPDSPPTTTSDKQGDQAPAAPSDPGTTSTGTAGVAVPDQAGSPGAADYMSLLQAWLEKHKQYPRRAQTRRLQGTALLYFAMDADGRVLSFRIERSSGHALLDAEVEAMIRRATPLPAVPPSLRGARLEFVVPVQFVLR